MADARNKIEKEIERAAIAKMQARLRGPPAPPFVPKCAGCGLKGLHHPKQDGGTIRFFSSSPKQWGDSGEYICEHCLETRTGMNPNDIP